MAGKRDKNQQQRDRDRVAKLKPGCYICGKPIDYTLKTPHPMSFELDHVIPIDKGGADDLSNKSASHRDCNSKKRARKYAPIVRRSGSLG